MIIMTNEKGQGGCGDNGPALHSEPMGFKFSEEPDFDQIKESRESGQNVVEVGYLLSQIEDTPGRETEQLYHKPSELLMKTARPEYVVTSEEANAGSKQELSPFQVAAQSMVTIHGDIKKEVISAGCGNPVQNLSLVTISYNGYLEYSEEPFDSTILRKQPKVFRLGLGEVIVGLELAVSSMKLRETSKFLIPPMFAYSEAGCPPRVPPHMWVMFEVTLDAVVVPKNAEAYSKLDLDESQHDPLTVVLETAKMELRAGVVQFTKKDFYGASARFQKGIRLLENCRLKDETDEKNQQHTIRKLYSNLSICYVYMNRPAAAIVQAKNALWVKSDDPKMMLWYGKAKAMLTDYDEALKWFGKALTYEPESKEVLTAIKQVKEKQMMNSNFEKVFCRNALGFFKGDKTEKAVPYAYIPDFTSPQSDPRSVSFRKQLSAFVADTSATECTFPIDMTMEDREVLFEIARQFELEHFCRYSKTGAQPVIRRAT